MLNGYIRVDGGEDTIVVSRQSDWCVLYRGKVPLGGADLLASEIVEKLKGKPDPTKCLLCTNAAVEKEYCEYCSIVVTEHDDTCAVCLDEERKEAVWGQLACGHVFHYECAKVALSAAKRCPLCRHPGGKMSIY
jgi:hypothetical protein